MRIATVRPASHAGRRLMAVAVGLLLVGLVGCSAPAVSPPAAQDPGKPPLTDAETALYSMLENAARQQRVHVAMYRETFATEADAAARKNVGTIASAVSEVDTKGPTFRSVYANNLQRADGFTLGRCLGKTAYVDEYPDYKKRPKTLAAAAGRVYSAPKGDLRELTTPRATDPCPHLGVTTGSATSAMSRLSDGVMPVTLTPEQAANWAAALREARLFTVRDEGTETRNGTTLRRISFAPRKDDYTVNARLFTMFETAGEIDKVRNDSPKTEVNYKFVPVNPINSGGVGGFYLLDPAKNLPVSSELYGTNPDRPAATVSRANGFNIARTKQSYEFPSELTITSDTPLEFLD